MSEWEAYERATGPLGFDYLHESVAQLVEQVKLSNYLTGFKWEENPVPEPEHHPRPEEVYKPPLEDEDDPEVMTISEFSVQFTD